LYLWSLLLNRGERRGGEGERKRRGGQERRRGEGREFVLCPRKKKEKSAPMELS